MFEARLNQASILKKVVDAIKDLTKQAQFECTQTGIALQAMDHAHVVLIHLVLQSDGFENYRCDRSNDLGLDISVLSKILKCANNDDIITLSAEDEGDVVNIVFDDKDGLRFSEFEIKLVDIDQEKLHIPAQEYPAVVNMSASELQRIVRDLGNLGAGNVVVTVTKEGIKFSVKGDTANGTVMLRPTGKEEDDEAVIIELAEPVEVTYSMQFLKEFIKATPLSPKVRLCLSESIPGIFHYDVGDNGRLDYFLAPKTEDDENDDMEDNEMEEEPAAPEEAVKDEAEEEAMIKEEPSTGPIKEEPTE